MSFLRIETARPGARVAALGAGFAGLAVLSTGVGALLAGIALRFDDAAPLVLLGLIAIPLLALAILVDPRVGILVVFATFPLGASAIPTGFGTLEIVNVAVVLIAILVALRRLGAGRSALPWPPQMWWMFGVVVWALIALPSALDQDLAIKEIVPLVAGVGFACVVVAVCRDMSDARKILGAFILVSTVVAAGAFVGGGELEATFGGARVAHGRAASSFDHSNQLGCLASMASLSAIGLVMGARTRRARLAALAAIPVLVAAQLLSLSRGAWIGTVVAVIYLLATVPRARRVLLAASIPIALIAVLVGSIQADSTQVQVIGERLSSLTVLSPYDDRQEIWQEARREIRADPVTGQGPGSFPAASARAVSKTTTVFAYHAHSILLTWAAENGIPAALLILGFALALALTVHRITHDHLRERPGDTAIVSGIAAALLSLFAQGVVDYTLRNAVIFFSLWAIVGLLLATDRILGRPEATPGRWKDSSAGDTPELDRVHK